MKTTSFLLTTVLSIFLLFSCNKGEYYFIEGLAQGTSYHITYRGTENYNKAIDSILKAFDHSLSAWDSTSVLSRINRNDPTVIPDSLFIKVFNKAKEVNAASDGMFDITVGPLVKAWGFYDTLHMRHDSATIHKLLGCVGMSKVQLINGKIVKQNPDIVIDVNAIAQGFSVDVVSSFLERQHVRNYVVEIGGELKTKGKNPDGKNWRIGIDKPFDGNNTEGKNLQTILEVSGKAIATSGNYRRFIMEKGVKYAHHLNPKTGYPSRNPLLSVSVVTNDCITADAYGTACMVLGLEKSIELLKRRKDLEAYFIYSDSLGNFKVYMSDGLKKYVKK